MRKALYKCLVGLIPFCFAACSVEKYVKPSDKLLLQNQFAVEMPDGQSVPKETTEALTNMKNYAIQTPNKRLLGTMRLKMHVFCLSNPKDSNAWNNYLRRTGEPPVVYDFNSSTVTAQQLRSLLVSKGCFHSSVNFDTVHSGRRDVLVTYHLRPSPRYQIEEVSRSAETPEVNRLLEETAEASFLKAGDFYDQENISNERDRIVELLQNEGFYRISKDCIHFLVDTTYAEGQLSIHMTVSNPKVLTADKRVMVVPLQRYHINQIYIYPNSTANGADGAMDTLIYRYTTPRGRSTDYTFVYQGELSLKPKTIARNMFLFHGQTYRPRNLSRTYNSLLSLKNFKYIDLDVVESPSSCDSSLLLDARVRLLNNTRQKISASLELTNTSSFGNQSSESTHANGDFGLEGVLTYQNKNLFGGAEILKVEGSLLMELPKLIFRNGLEGEFHDNVTAFEAGLEMNLDVPNFLLPFTHHISWQQTKPHTVFNLGADYQFRYYFERVLANTSMGYSWSKNRNIHHQLLPLELTYVRFIDLDEAFLARIAGTSDPRLKYQYSDHFIMDARYDLLFSNQKINTRTDFSYVHLSAESAGNLLQGVCSLAQVEPDENGIRHLFGVPYSQYVRFNGEVKHYFYRGKRRTLVTRLMAGVGLPYTNSSAMPYEKSFYGGGPTTMRAWQLRYLGPGNYPSEGSQMFERVGDMTLVANVEERFPIVGIFEGALFTDIGNVWLVNPSEEWPGGHFSWKNFPSSLAVGAGVGLRMNISIVTLRADFAIPVYDPGYDPDLRWRVPHWRIKDVVTNFGIDYPF